MRRRAAVLLAMLALAACHASVELDPGHLDAGIDASTGDAGAPIDGDDPDMEMDVGDLPDADAGEPDDGALDAHRHCGPFGSVCSVAADCCTGHCGVGLRCESAACEVAGAACTTAVDCCSGACTASICAAAVGCAPSGEPCAHGNECCTRTCADDETGTSVCQPLGGCAIAGELCRRDTDCCGGAPGACAGVDLVSGLGRCGVSTGCAADGEICRVAGDPSATRECCPLGAGHGLCHATGAGVVDRCVSMRAASACLVPASACATPDECCSRICAPDDGGVLVCQPSCRLAAQTCSRSADCCTGTCSNGACVGTATCAALGATCATSTECCSRLCGAGLTCEATPI